MKEDMMWSYFLEPCHFTDRCKLLLETTVEPLTNPKRLERAKSAMAITIFVCIITTQTYSFAVCLPGAETQERRDKSQTFTHN